MSPTVKFIGRTTYLRGKRLFDILARLKNFGVGRIVYRNHFMERYAPDPSYYVITKVDPDMSDLTEAEIDISQKGKSRAWGMRVWRGVPLGEQVITRCHRDDWRLVHRHEEEKFLSYEVPKRQPNIVPDRIPFPPLFEHLLLEERRRTGIHFQSSTLERPMLQLEIKPTSVGAIYESELKIIDEKE